MAASPENSIHGAMNSKPGGKWMANLYQGQFPQHNSAKKGFGGIATVRVVRTNGYGLHDVGGNVWEWGGDWYRPDYYADLAPRRRYSSKSNGDLKPPSIPGSQTCRSGSIAAARTSAVTPIAPATWWARPAKVKSAQAQTISVSAVCKRPGTEKNAPTRSITQNIATRRWRREPHRASRLVGDRQTAECHTAPAETTKINCPARRRR